MATIALHSCGLTSSCLPLPTKTELVDSHCHFDFSDFDADRDAVWQDCRNQQITTMIVPGVEPAQWPRLAQLSLGCVGIFHAIGIHPWWVAKLFSETISAADIENLTLQLRKNLVTAGCVAIGECGLDATITAPFSEQLKILTAHVQLASELCLPLILHCRKNHNELIALLKQYRLPAGGVIHGFSGSSDLALQYWSMGFQLGIGGTVTYERANKTRTAVKNIPIDAILLETDAPDMPLAGKQGMRNTPANIFLIAQAVAELRGESLEFIAKKTTENARRLFQLDPY